MQKTVLLIVFTSLFLLSGCDSRAKESDLEAAYTQIEACEYEGALAALDIAEESGEDMAYILRARGVANMGLTNYEEAVEQFIAALGYSDWRIDDFDIDVNYYLADTYERMGKDSEAIDTYSAILGIREKDMLAHYRRGRVRLRQNRDMRMRAGAILNSSWPRRRRSCLILIRDAYIFIWRIMPRPRPTSKRRGMMTTRVPYFFWARPMRCWAIIIMQPVPIRII